MKTIFICASALLLSAAVYAAPPPKPQPVKAQPVKPPPQQIKKQQSKPQPPKPQQAEPATTRPDTTAALKTLKAGQSVLTEISPRPELKKWMDSEPLPRNFPQQPPVIPHSTKGYVLNLKVNKCLTCHSNQNAKISGATPVGMSHYVDRNGRVTQKIAGRRYFCEQCHVPQADTELLTGNDFKTAEGAK